MSSFEEPIGEEQIDEEKTEPVKARTFYTKSLKDQISTDVLSDFGIPVKNKLKAPEQLSFGDFLKKAEEGSEYPVEPRSFPVPIAESLENIPEPEKSFDERLYDYRKKLSDIERERSEVELQSKLKRAELGLERYREQTEKFASGELARRFVAERNAIYKLLRMNKGTDADLYVFRDILNEARVYGVDLELYGRLLNLKKSLTSPTRAIGEGVVAVGKSVKKIPEVGASALKTLGSITSGLSKRQAEIFVKGKPFGGSISFGPSILDVTGKPSRMFKVPVSVRNNARSSPIRYRYSSGLDSRNLKDLIGL